MEMYGMDLSHYQDSLDLSKGNYDFCIIKATEGIGYTDYSFYKFAEQLTKLNKLVGCYHYARPDLHGDIEGIEKEANWFIKVVEKADLIGKALLVLDWEKPPTDNEELIKAWLKKVKDTTGVTPFIYGGKYKLTKWKKLGWTILDEYPIWGASWNSNIQYQIGMPISRTKPVDNWIIWQYSSRCRYPDSNIRVDADVAYINKDMWLKYAKGKKVEDISLAMQWCINKGIFVGDGEGHYMPKEPLTREQAAQVIYNIFNKWDLSSLANQVIENGYKETDSILIKGGETK